MEDKIVSVNENMENNSDVDNSSKRAKLEDAMSEVEKAVLGKHEVVKKILTVILAGGHVLLEDIPGVGKTTIALAFSKTLGLKFKRVQFTPDVVPSDITGFSMYNKLTGNFEYVEGAAMCNFLLADEINRTSSKTQSALLEVMQESKITVDGNVHYVQSPFIVMATQNPLGTAGTQMLPEAQLDRFMIQTSMGYPDKAAQIKILQDRQVADPIENIRTVLTAEDIISLKSDVNKVYVDSKIHEYIIELVEATRNHELLRLGISPRGSLAIMRMAMAAAFISGRDYVVPKDISDNFITLTAHRTVLSGKAQVRHISKEEVLQEILAKIDAPIVDTK